MGDHFIMCAYQNIMLYSLQLVVFGFVNYTSVNLILCRYTFNVEYMLNKGYYKILS